MNKYMVLSEENNYLGIVLNAGLKNSGAQSRSLEHSDVRRYFTGVSRESKKKKSCSWSIRHEKSLDQASP